MTDTAHDPTGGHTDANEFWEERYRDGGGHGGDRPNARLPELVADLGPGAVLDLACGPGGDTLWFAGHGWHVTAVDISSAATTRLAERAAERGFGDRVRTERHDLAETFPTGEFDLVSAFYLHTPFELDRVSVLRTAARALRPGGHLLVVDHNDVAPWMSVDDGHRFPTPQEIADALALDPAEWTTVRADRPRREATGPDGTTATVTDGVLLIRRS
ncbi:class I SAM-dependent methyltransferase [Pseudonocardia endophytica]|uniref:Methyltransferase family protein n=1 Tax=Pseudonocardia endophytica TaxID=401976 RepID=A0A4R1HY02_PSEEN|nr:class I SAM-dependent methyltransferase [Pseudonocardia endophytica]TCK27684.1 methyltransferase family protein [Pseudonocardia endophytica]